MSVGEREKKVANSWKLSFLSTVPRNCLQPPGFIQRLPVNDLSKGQVLTGIGIRLQNIFNHCILKWELQYFVVQNFKIFICLSVTPQLTWGKVFFSEDVLYQNVLLCGSANFSEFWRNKGFPLSILYCIWYYLGCGFVRNREQSSVVMQWVEDLHRKIKWHKKWH